MLGRMQVGDAPQPAPVGPSRPSRRAVAIAATAALAVIAGSIVAAVLLSRHAPSVGIGDSTTSPTGAATTSANPSASEPGPAVSVIPYPAGAQLLQVTVPTLRMRAAATTTADVVRSFDLGEVVRVVSGPVEADGYSWYEVIDLDSHVGWAAMGGGSAPWLDTVPPDPATSTLLLSLERTCEAGIRDIGIPVVPADVAVMADGRVILITGVVRQLSPAGLAQIQRDVLAMPSLQTSAEYLLEPNPAAPPAPGHGACIHHFRVGEGPNAVVVNAWNWQGDVEETAYWLPAPERHALDDLTMHLFDIEMWLGPPAWSEPARRYVSDSYSFWLERSGDAAPPDTPSLAGAAWPFDGPIEQFGDPVRESAVAEAVARCGYLNLGEAFETLRLMRQRGVTAFMYSGENPRELALDGFGSGSFSTDAGFFTFWLTPRSPDRYPACPDAS